MKNILLGVLAFGVLVAGYFVLKPTSVNNNGSPALGDDYEQGEYASAEGIEVISPNGGEVWSKGQKVKILWNSSEKVKNVNIRLAISGSGEGQTFNAGIVSNIPNTGEFEWTVQDLYAEVWGVTDLPVANNYLITVVDVGDSSVHDSSDTVFSVR